MEKLLLYGFFGLFLANCNNSDDIDPAAIDCTEVACTEQFVTLIVTVKDDSGALIPLDTFEVIDKESSENLTIALSDSGFQMARQSGQYPLYNDSFVSGNQNTKRTLLFRGFINDEKIAEAEYMVDTDCCHISIATGDTNITIN